MTGKLCSEVNILFYCNKFKHIKEYYLNMLELDDETQYNNAERKVILCK